MVLRVLNDLDEQAKNEENTKLNYITPAIQSKWNADGDYISMEYNPKTGENGYYFTDGRINVNDDNVATRGERKKIDYLLLFKNNIPLALVEAKGFEHDLNEGVQQALDYASILDVPFAYASNGKAFHEEDRLLGKNCVRTMDDFPTSNELWERYIAFKNIDKTQEEIITNPYYLSQDGKKPRYYQRIAINRVTEAIAKGQNRLLLVMATGTGKTYTAMQIIYRLWNSGNKKKILFLVDRTALADQTFDSFVPFKNVMCRLGESINRLPIDAKTPEHVQNMSAYQVFISLYHQLKDGDRNYYENIPRDFFDLIVVDECHRSSVAGKRSVYDEEDYNDNWHDILEYFSSATQIGLTATPKETESVSNIDYFGKPVYTYSLKQGIEDGFLAPYKVISVELDIDRDGYMPAPDEVDLDGNPIEQRLYTQKDFDRTIIVQDRRELVARRITEYMKTNNRFSKAIIFCETEEHAGEMVNILKNLNSDLVAEDSRYVMQITSSNEIGKLQIKNFIAPSQKYPVIAVTSKLLSTGVDAQTTELIVLDKTIGSMTEFKQTIGRGTRIKENYKVDGEEKSKTHFTIMDFRKNYLKFRDPEFDGEPVTVQNIAETKKFDKPKVITIKPKTEIVKVNGIDVEIVGEETQYLDEDGNLVKMNIDSCIKNNIHENYESYDDFKNQWFNSDDRRKLASELLFSDKFVSKIRNEFGFNIDVFDIISYAGWGVNPTSKEERIHKSSLKQFLTNYPDEIQKVLNILLECYKNTDFIDLVDINIFDLPIFMNNGYTKKQLVYMFGGVDNYIRIVKKVEEIIYSEGE